MKLVDIASHDFSSFLLIIYTLFASIAKVAKTGECYDILFRILNTIFF